MNMDQYYTMDGAFLYGVCPDGTPHPSMYRKTRPNSSFVFAGTFAKHNLPLRHHPGTLRQISKGRSHGGELFCFRVRELGQLMGPKTSLFSPEKNKKITS
jgi:hypothetical protein